ncbi:SDR family NAD(P)-dependent oxidoreductase [Aidingimonas halophila]|uniref:Gluconate 5-dehydrogenase n=1 Tax=Aidingimonas halophila TaxID=574349 RepID=A0A1H3GRI4_9GAMM|nr:glucose 1-dehydrogenase [Aidingimonas halophila]GHC35853.1 2-deoxy-D-gluconate 3-dehydrogenase [Aidingimonas halophila]SDY05933.1 gluconate 5-dehydrogenase [Aidingimonas halophila]
MPTARLSGLNALVIGGSSGIGQTLAEGFQREGARVAIAARTTDKVSRVTERLRESDSSALGYTVDVTERQAIDRLATDVSRDMGTLDILVNCQGTTVIKPATEVSEAEFDQVLDTNLKSVYFTSTVLGGLMLDRGQGAIINIASLAAHRGWPNACAYSISKHGILGLTRTLAAEWAEQGVRVNSISPGFFLTELNRDRMPAERKQAALTRTPYNRFGEVDELVGAALFLASEESGFVTGTDISVDGGYLAGGI